MHEETVEAHKKELQEVQRDHAEASDALEEKFEHAKGRAATLEAEKTALLEKMGQLEEDARKEVMSAMLNVKQHGWKVPSLKWVYRWMLGCRPHVARRFRQPRASSSGKRKGSETAGSSELREKFEKASETVKMTQLTVENLKRRLHRLSKAQLLQRKKTKSFRSNCRPFASTRALQTRSFRACSRALRQRIQIASLSAEGDVAMLGYLSWKHSLQRQMPRWNMAARRTAKVK